MSETSPALSISARIEAIGIPKKQFASRAGVDRGTLDRVLAGDGSVQGRTVAKIERALTDLEDEIGMAESGRLVTTTVEVNGATVTVKGTPEDVAETVRRFLA